jgi:hypothetical protein
MFGANILKSDTELLPAAGFVKERERERILKSLVKQCPPPL